MVLRTRAVLRASRVLRADCLGQGPNTGGDWNGTHGLGLRGSRAKARGKGA